MHIFVFLQIFCLIIINNLPCSAASPDEMILHSGYFAIRERALEDLPVSILATEGIKGLSSIDPSFTVSTNSSSISVFYNNKKISSFPRPPDDDIQGWSHLICLVIEKTAPLSTGINQASRERLHQSIFDASLALLDVFSHYSGPSQARINKNERNGFGGIGIYYKKNDRFFVITSVIRDSPADKTGLRAEDIIISINGKTVANLEHVDLAERLRGAAGSPVQLEIQPANSTQNKLITIKRDIIVPPTASLHDLRGVPMLTITSFNQNTARSVEEILNGIHDNQPGLIIDLRNNQGGLLDQAIAVANHFISQGPILTTRGRHHDAQKKIMAQAKHVINPVRMVVIIDRYTTSAAEILAAALQDLGKAVVIGTSSFGKGTVQTVATLPDDSELILTWARFFAPSGYAIQDIGVLPDLCTSSDRGGNEMILTRLSAGQVNIHPTIKARQTISLNDRQGRANLRNTCPVEDHSSRTSDEQLARLLLLSPDKYDRALSLRN